VLDALMDYLALKFPNDQLRTGVSRSFKSSVFERRAEIELKTPELEISADPILSPHLAHPTQRFTLAASHSDREGHQIESEFRFAMHSLTDPERGYPSQGEVEFLAFRARMPTRSWKPVLQEIRLLNITSLNDVTSWDSSSSFRLRIAFDKDPLGLCRGCGIPNLRAGRGASVLLAQTPRAELRTFGFLNGGVLLGRFEHGVIDATLGASIGVHGRIRERVAFIGELFWDSIWKNPLLRNSFRGSTQVNFHFIRNWSGYSGLDWNRNWGLEGRVGLAHYF
jgi:hypothetical protein